MVITVGKSPAPVRGPGSKAHWGRAARDLAAELTTAGPLTGLGCFPPGQSWLGRASGWIPARCAGSHCPPVAILGAQGPGAGEDRAGRQGPRVAKAIAPLWAGAPCPTAPPGKWQIFWSETSRPTKTVSIASHQPPGGRYQPLQRLPLLSGDGPAPQHTHPEMSHVYSSSGGPCQLTHPPQTSAATWAEQRLGVLATWTSCEFGTSMSDHKGLRPLGV